MKAFFRIIITFILTLKARRFLKKNSVDVIAVTGSIGKTSTKAAIYSVLKDHFKVYSSEKGFNTEIGLCLSILEEETSGFRSPIAWAKILTRALLKKKPSYRKIVLEMGADHRGDIKKLMRIAPPKISVVTNVAPVHLDEGQFKDIHDIAREKGTLIKELHPSRLAVVNYDDPLIREMRTPARRITYGTDPSAMMVAQDVHATNKYLSFRVEYKGDSASFKVPVLGVFQVYVLMPAIAIALELGVPIKQCAESLSRFSLPRSRMNPIDGVNDSHIIDSSYNASPVTMKKALELLEELKAGRKIVALGTMNEQGSMTKEVHMELGKHAASVADVMLFVGPEASTLKQGAMDGGAPSDKIYTFFDSEEAGAFLRGMLQPNDLVLVKGSQNRVRMEKLIRSIMKDPDAAAKLLCRQGTGWGV